MAQGLKGAALISFLGGSLNTLLGWNLALGTRGSSTPLPRDAVSVVAVTALLALLAGFCAFVAEPRRYVDWIRRHPLQAGGLSLTGLAILGLGAFQIGGGGLGAALRSGNADTVRVYLKAHPTEPEALRKNLYQELKAGHLEVAGALLEAYSGLDQRTGEQQTTLLAEGVVFFPKDSVLLLLQKRADPKISDKFGRSPAHRLVLYRLPNFSAEGEEGMIELLKALQQNGSDLNQPGQDGETPLKAAQARGQTKVVQFLQGS